jgi:hypothetical protein
MVIINVSTGSPRLTASTGATRFVRGTQQRRRAPLIRQEATMKATLVGGDRLGNIPQILEAQGIEVMRHVCGRGANEQRRTTLPRGTDLLILFTDFLNHNAMRAFREAARNVGVPVLACRRSASALVEALQRSLPVVCAARD